MKPGNCCSRGVQKVARTLQDLLTIPTPQIVVAQHDDGRALQVGAKHPLAAGVETVAVDQGKDRGRFHRATSTILYLYTVNHNAPPMPPATHPICILRTGSYSFEL